MDDVAKSLVELEKAQSTKADAAGSEQQSARISWLEEALATQSLQVSKSRRESRSLQQLPSQHAVQLLRRASELGVKVDVSTLFTQTEPSEIVPGAVLAPFGAISTPQSEISTLSPHDAPTPSLSPRVATSLLPASKSGRRLSRPFSASAFATPRRRSYASRQMSGQPPVVELAGVALQAAIPPCIADSCDGATAGMLNLKRSCA